MYCSQPNLNDVYQIYFRQNLSRPLALYLSWSMLCMRWWRDKGLIWYWRTWQVLGCSLGVI